MGAAGDQGGTQNINHFPEDRVSEAHGCSQNPESCQLYLILVFLNAPCSVSKSALIRGSTLENVSDLSYDVTE